MNNRKHGLWLCFVIKSYVKMSQPVSFVFRCVCTDLTVNIKSEIDMKNKRNSKFSPFRSSDIINLTVLSKKKKNHTKISLFFHYDYPWGRADQDKSTLGFN